VQKLFPAYIGQDLARMTRLKHILSRKMAGDPRLQREEARPRSSSFYDGMPPHPIPCSLPITHPMISEGGCYMGLLDAMHIDIRLQGHFWLKNVRPNPTLVPRRFTGMSDLNPTPPERLKYSNLESESFPPVRGQVTCRCQHGRSGGSGRTGA
jgi:hypothetical protein